MMLVLVLVLAAALVVLLLLPRQTSINEFKPLPWASSPLLQSILGLLFHKVKPRDVRREIIPIKPFGTLALDWIESTASLCSSPIIINFSGVSECYTTSEFGSVILTSIQDHYAATKNKSIRAVNAVYPGFNGHVIDSNKVPCSAFLSTDIVGEVLRHISNLYPDAQLVIVGWSLGAGLVANWLSRNQTESKRFNIQLVLLYAYGQCLLETIKSSSKNMGGIARMHVLHLWKRKMKRNLNANTIIQWDRACLPLYGFKTMTEMYEASNPAPVFHKIKQNVVIINSDDDWLCPAERVKKIIMPNVRIIETRGGGHLGWIDSLYGLKSKWLVNTTLQLVEERII